MATPLTYPHHPTNSSGTQAVLDGGRYGVWYIRALFFGASGIGGDFPVKRLIVGVTASALLLVPVLAGQRQKTRAASAARVARGKYLVEQVGLCGDCHTPHNEKGEPIKEQWLKGATLTFQPTVPMPVWADKAVNIAGLPGWEKEAAIRFMMTGIARNEIPARPPMPQYRFNEPDAEAIVAYLKSMELAKQTH
ncbi:MAG TPA: c-type cytochrome [Terriglobales bacterium]|nr:c-type cytochrome [Terriglobales bacterium]